MYFCLNYCKHSSKTFFMKKALCLLMFTCFFFQFSITNAQIGNLKNKVSNASKEISKPKKTKKNDFTIYVSDPAYGLVKYMTKNQKCLFCPENERLRVS